VLNCQIPGRVTPTFAEIACECCNNIFIPSTQTWHTAFNQTQPGSIFIQKRGQQLGMAEASAATTIHEMPVMLVYSSGCAPAPLARRQCLSHAGLGRT
jgi:hypothetical protein